MSDSKTEITLHWHLGLGDAIICNGLVRTFVAKGYRVNLPCFNHNLASLSDMFSDISDSVRVIEVGSVEHMLSLPGDALKLGFYGANFNLGSWSRSFYEQAGLQESERWDKFHIPVDYSNVVEVPVFIHDDASRGYVIKKDGYRPQRRSSILDHIPEILGAKELHCIDSSFALLIDQVNPPGMKFIHRYSRKGQLPSYRQTWEFIDTPITPMSFTERAFFAVPNNSILDYKMGNLELTATLILNSNLPGDVAEGGVYKGGSARLLATVFPHKRVFLFDSFQGMLESDTYGEGHRKGDFKDTSLDQVKAYLSDKQNCSFFPGWLPDSAAFLTDEKFCFVHLDLDLYTSTKAAIEIFWPRLVEGGVMVFDDWEWHRCPGVRRSIDEYFAGVEHSKAISGNVCCIFKPTTVSGKKLEAQTWQ